VESKSILTSQKYRIPTFILSGAIAFTEKSLPAFMIQAFSKAPYFTYEFQREKTFRQYQHA
jgi:hypothetical protein